MESNLRLVKGKIEHLVPGPDLDRCLLLQLVDQVGSIKSDLSNIIRDILSPEKEEEDLLEKNDGLQDVLFDLNLQTQVQ